MHRASAVFKALLLWNCLNLFSVWTFFTMIISRSCHIFVDCTSMNRNSHRVPEVLYWIEIWWLWRPVQYSELITMFKKPVWGDTNFVIWSVTLLAQHGQQQYSGRLVRLVLGGTHHYNTITSDSDHTFSILQQVLRLIRPGNNFPIVCPSNLGPDKL